MIRQKLLLLCALMIIGLFIDSDQSQARDKTMKAGTGKALRRDPQKMSREERQFQRAYYALPPQKREEFISDYLGGRFCQPIWIWKYRAPAPRRPQSK